MFCLSSRYWGFMYPKMMCHRIVIHKGNQGTINLAKNPLNSRRTKHIDVRNHFLRDLVAKGQIEVIHVPTERQHADALTKPLPLGSFSRHRSFLLNSKNGRFFVIDIFRRACCRVGVELLFSTCSRANERTKRE